ncbi:MAG: radical SAM protein [Lentisphaeria bacterium]|nr:radical SAM protein [Lentisphaeria bacterium]
MVIDPEYLRWAEAQLRCCRLCPRDCRVDRVAGQRGFCGAGDQVHWFLEYVGYGEEPELTPSHTLFLTGCSLRCVFCHTADDEAHRPHRRLTPEGLQAMIHRAREEGAINLNLLGGEPAVNLPGILRLLTACADDLPPIVWNTSMYCSRACLAATVDWVSVYAADLKAFQPACAQRLLGAADYPAVARARFGELAARAPERILVRHLLVPGHIDCCTLPILRWIAAEMPGTRVSLQDFLPTPGCRGEPGLARFLRAEEWQRAVDAAQELGLPLVERLPLPDPEQPAEALDSQLARGHHARAAEPLDVQIVISPMGRLYLKHPSRVSTTLAAAALRGGPATQRSNA